jgi:TolB-like protein/Tfp pilus assembly protein PilF
MPEERVQRRLAAILAADVVGYSRLMERDEAWTFAALKSRRKEVLEPLVARYRGRIFKVAGDSVLVEFASAVNAVQCAIELQHGMDGANGDLPRDRRINLRIGVNLGDVMVEGSDLYGDGVNIAARLEGMAQPGSICISAKVHDEVQRRLTLTYDDLGEQQFKNIATPIRAFQIAGDGSRGIAVEALRPRTKPSIAVLPFANMSGDPEQQYLSDGITEDIITELARDHSLLVMARNSCFQFRGPSVDITRVQRELGVSYVVEGSVRRAGNLVRVTAQLIDARTQSHLWAERYDREMRDIFAVQDEVTHAVAATLEGRIAASGAEHARRRPTRDWVAYDYFLQGRECVNDYRLEKADSFFARAIELDPDYVHAHAWRAIALGIKYLIDEQQETLDEASASARRALALDENDAWSHSAMGIVALRQQQLDLAGQHFDRAFTLNPNDINAAGDRAQWLLFVGRLDEALRCLELALERDPYPTTWTGEVHGHILYHLKRYDEAIAALRSARVQVYWIPCFLAAAYGQVSRLEDAGRELTNLLSLKPDASLASFARWYRVPNQSLRDHLMDGLRKAGLEE